MEKRNIPFNKFYKRFNILSLFLILISLVLLTFKGLNYGVDFKGGTLIELRSLDQTLSISDLRKSFNKLNLGDVTVKKFGKENDYVIKFEKKQSIEENFIENIKVELSNDIGNIFEFRRVESVGPKVSSELLKSGVIAIALSLGAMLIYIWIRFEWQFSLGAISAVFHDVMIVLGVFSLTYKFMPFSMEIDQAFIAAILTVIGYSLNDTVVVFDRIREFLKEHSTWEFEKTVNSALNSTLSRTLNTSFTTLVVLLAMFTFGADSLRGLLFALIIGVLVGTYSSVFVATPIMKDTLKKFREK